MEREKKLNDKGFSLVELIIVMAIMAILIGAIAPQVFKYVEKARESKDLQLVNTVFTAVNTTLATAKTSVDDISETSLSSLFSSTDQASLKTELDSLINFNFSSDAEIQKQFNSDAAKGGIMYVKYVDGILEVYIGKTSGTGTGATTVPVIGPVTN